MSPVILKHHQDDDDRVTLAVRTATNGFYLSIVDLLPNDEVHQISCQDFNKAYQVLAAFEEATR